MPKPKPLVLIVLDGWGYAPPSNANAISLARKPNYDKLLAEYPNTLIHTSGRYVGLPDGQMGNSEVGHLNIGAGRVVYMDITRIDLMIENGELFWHPVLLDAMKHASADGGGCIFSDCSPMAACTRIRTISMRCCDGQAERRGARIRPLLSWMAATRRRTPARATSSNCSRRCASTASARSPRSAVVTTPWTATASGIARRRRSTPWCMRQGRSAALCRPGAGR